MISRQSLVCSALVAVALLLPTSCVMNPGGSGAPREGGTITGLRAEREGNDLYVRAQGGVVLACGGFEWNDELRDRFLPGPLTLHCSPATNEGDGLVMASEGGAALVFIEGWIASQMFRHAGRFAVFVEKPVDLGYLLHVTERADQLLHLRRAERLSRDSLKAEVEAKTLEVRKLLIRL